MSSPPPNPYQMLYTTLCYQEQRIRELEKNVSHLKQELLHVRQQRSIHVDRIEYKFDQLKVEKLDGSLTIGVTPSGTQSAIEDLVVDGQQVQPSATTKSSGPFDQIHNQVDHFLTEQCPSFIQSLESKHRIIVGSEYRTMIINDIRNQMRDRIQHYLNTLQVDESADIVAEVARKVESDIRLGIEQHFEHYLKKENDNDDDT